MTDTETGSLPTQVKAEVKRSLGFFSRIYMDGLVD